MGTGADVNSGAISLEGDKQLRIFRNSMNGVKIWRFVLDNAYWWVTQRGVIWGAGTHAASSTEATLEASSDEQAYARYLAM